MKLRLLIASLNLIAIKAHHVAHHAPRGPRMGPGPCDWRGVKTGPDGNCIDINECETGEHDCPSDHVCFNLDATISRYNFEYYCFDCKPAWLQTTSSSTTSSSRNHNERSNDNNYWYHHQNHSWNLSSLCRRFFILLIHTSEYCFD